MNKDQFKGKWKQMKGNVKLQWGKLTNDQIEQIDGRREKLVGKIQEMYGKTKEDVEKEVSKWQDKFKSL